MITLVNTYSDLNNRKIFEMESFIVQMLLNCSPKRIAKTILLPAGDLSQNRIISKLKEVKKCGRTYRGKIGELKVSVVNSGIGAPFAATILEALIRAGVQRIIRLDFCGGISEDIEIGDLVISSSAIRGDGTTPHYLPDSKDLKIDGDIKLTNHMVEQFKQAKIPFHVGPVYSHDAIFKEPDSLIQKIKELNCIAIDMETSILFTIGALNNISTTSIMVVSDHPAKNQKLFEMKTLSPVIFKNLDRAIDIVFNGLIKFQKF